MTLPQWIRNGLNNELRKRFGKLMSMREANGPEANAHTTLARGHRAESLAAAYLTRQGLRLIDRNVRAGHGEIDLIMHDGQTLVFIEVRARKMGAWVSAAESVSLSKRKKIIETAERLLNKKPAWRKTPCRFDVVAIGLPVGPSSKPDVEQPKIDWIQDAFQAE